ncbi:hypothetical protein ACOME3_004454 [Neoechinorhynchus agilis]
MTRQTEMKTNTGNPKITDDGDFDVSRRDIMNECNMNLIFGQSSDGFVPFSSARIGVLKNKEGFGNVEFLDDQLVCKRMKNVQKEMDEINLIGNSSFIDLVDPIGWNEFKEIDEYRDLHDQAVHESSEAYLQSKIEQDSESFYFDNMWNIDSDYKIEEFKPRLRKQRLNFSLFFPGERRDKNLFDFQDQSKIEEIPKHAMAGQYVLVIDVEPTNRELNLLCSRNSFEYDAAALPEQNGSSCLQDLYSRQFVDDLDLCNSMQQIRRFIEEGTLTYGRSNTLSFNPKELRETLILCQYQKYTIEEKTGCNNTSLVKTVERIMNNAIFSDLTKEQKLIFDSFLTSYNLLNEISSVKSLFDHNSSAGLFRSYTSYVKSCMLNLPKMKRSPIEPLKSPRLLHSCIDKRWKAGFPVYSHQNLSISTLFNLCDPSVDYCEAKMIELRIASILRPIISEKSKSRRLLSLIAHMSNRLNRNFKIKEAKGIYAEMQSIKPKCTIGSYRSYREKFKRVVSDELLIDIDFKTSEKKETTAQSKCLDLDIFDDGYYKLFVKRARVSAEREPLSAFTNQVLDIHVKRAEKTAERFIKNLIEGPYRNRLIDIFIKRPMMYNVDSVRSTHSTMGSESVDAINFNASKPRTPFSDSNVQIASIHPSKTSFHREDSYFKIEGSDLEAELKEIRKFMRQKFEDTDFYKSLEDQTNNLESQSSVFLDILDCLKRVETTEIAINTKSIRKISRSVSTSTHNIESSVSNIQIENGETQSKVSISINATVSEDRKRLIRSRQMVDYEFMKGKSNCNSFDLKKSWENCSQIKKIEVHELSKLLKNKRFNDESNYIHFYMGKSPIDGVIHIPSKKIESNSFSMGKTSSNALLAQQLKFQLKNGKSLSETDHYYEDFKLPNNEIELTLVDIDQCVVECVKKALRRNNFDDVDTCISAFLNKMILNRVGKFNSVTSSKCSIFQFSSS